MKHILLAAALGAASLAPAQAATVFFDGFESNALGTPSKNGTQNVAGWVVKQGTVDVIGTNFFQWYGTGRYLDMNGSSGTPGKIERTITGLKQGATYTLSFSYGYNKNSGTNEKLSFGIANLEGSLGQTDFAKVTGSTFATALYTFKARSGAHKLFFADTGTTNRDNGGAILDNVKIDLAAVPLPAGAPLLAAALGGLALLRRRRKA